MIERLMNLNHFTYKKPFSGSDKNRQFRYIIRMIINEEPTKEKMLRAICWWGEFNSSVTPDQEKKVREFEFSEEGYDEAIKWLNEESDRMEQMSS